MSLLKNKSRSHSSEEIFRPADSQSLRLKSAVFEIQLSHGFPLLSARKQFLVCSEKVPKR